MFLKHPLSELCVLPSAQGLILAVFQVSIAAPSAMILSSAIGGFIRAISNSSFLQIIMTTSIITAYECIFYVWARK